MSYCRLEIGMPRHPKTLRLAARLRVSRREAIGILADLWCWVQAVRPSGMLDGLESPDIEVALDWVGLPGQLAAALVDTGWLDITGCGYEVHGWAERAESYKRASRERGRRTRSVGARAPQTPPRGEEREEREERRGEEKIGGEPPVPPATEGAPMTLELLPPEPSERPGGWKRVATHYQSHHPQARPGAKEQRLYADRRREGYSDDNLCLAIDGCHLSPFHLGQNENQQKHLGLKVIFRDSSQVASIER